MASSERGLEEQLTEAGNRLLQPPAAVDELLSLLDEVEKLLSRVEQSPSKSMQNAFSPATKALVANKLLRHADVDIKVAVASCISEITRITAPDAPYDDDQMKDVFQLIVSSFENLSDKSSRSYNKRTSILETVAKVRSCVVMLDLECDGLIVEMFQHFLKAIREYHPDNVFSSMETIMTLVLEESEDISPELLSPILASAKRGNEEIQPIARKLGEIVFKNCAIKLKPYLTEALKSLNLSLDDYSNVVASICEGTTNAAEHSDNIASGEKMVGESKLASASSEVAAQVDESKLASGSSDAAPQVVAKENVTEEVSAEEVNPPIDSSPKCVMSNGVPDTEKEEGLVDPDSETKANQSVITNGTSRDEADESDTVKSVKPEAKPEHVVKRRGRKVNPLISPTETSDSPQVDKEKEAERPSDRLKSRIKEGPGSPSEDPPVDPAVDSEKEKETAVQLSSPKAQDSEAAIVASSNTSGSIPDESRSKKMGRPKKKEILAKKASPSTDIVYKKASQGTSDSEVKPQKRSGKKKKPTESSKEDKSPAQGDTLMNDNVSGSDSEAKLGKKMETGSNADVGSSLKKKEDGKRSGRGKAALENVVSKSAAVADDKEIVSSPKSASKSAEDEGHAVKTSKTNKKRKQTPDNGKAPDSEELGGNLVGKKVKVWWPKDHEFYKGVVESYDSAKKKHTVSYDDGDVEILNLKKERWEFIGDDSGSASDEEQVADFASPDASPDVHKKKKVKISGSSAKQGKMEASPKRVGGSSSSKLKSASTKSVLKLEEDSKVDSKSKDVITKSGGSKSKDGGGRTKKKSQSSSGKSAENVSETVPKSKDVDVDVDTPKTGTKSKQELSKSIGKDTPKTVKKEAPKTSTKETPKTAASKLKGSGKSGSKTNANANDKDKEKEKEKSSSSKAAETEDTNRRKTPESGKTSESSKGGKTPDAAAAAASSKARESETTKSGGKKRRRGVRS